MAFTLGGLARPRVQIEAGSIPLLPRVITMTDLLSFVSWHALALSGSSTLNEVRLQPTTLRRSLGVTCRRKGFLSPAAARILTLLRTHGQSLFAKAQNA
jgi:hypothetical protein